MLTCIGKRTDHHGKLFNCTNTSKTPSISPVTNRPTGQYLCSECANSRTGRRVVYSPDLPDFDKPNMPEFEASDIRHGSRNMADNNGEDFENLEEVEL